MSSTRRSTGQIFEGERSGCEGFLNVTSVEAEALRELLNHHSDTALQIPESELVRLRPDIDELLGAGSTSRLCSGTYKVRVFAEISALHALGMQRFT